MLPDHRAQLQFSLKRLLVSTTLIAVGLAIVVWWYRFVIATMPADVRNPDAWSRFGLAPIWALGGAMIGAGLLNPFRMLLAGALIGCLVQAALIAFFVLRALDIF